MNHVTIYVLIAFFGLSLSSAQAASSSSNQAKATRGISDQANTRSPKGVTPVVGLVSDPSGALIVGARVVFTAQSPNDGALASKETFTSSSGRFAVEIAPGAYSVRILADGFEPFTQTIKVTLAKKSMDVRLAISTVSDQVEVASDDTRGGDQNSFILRREQIDALSSDDKTMQNEVLSMAGGNPKIGNSLFVNGFSGGRFPPKDSIREIRINQAPFSAQFADVGDGRIEVSTKQGSDAVHGNLYSAGSTKEFNSLNPYTGAQPPYFILFNRGDVSGPMGKKTSFFVSGDQGFQQNNAVVNAYNSDGSPLSEAVPAPQASFSLSGRIDHQVGKSDALFGRYEYNRSTISNNGVGQLVLPSQGSYITNVSQSLQFGVTRVLRTDFVSESRLQYLRTRTSELPNTTTPTIIVQGALSGGGTPSQTTDDRRDQLEVQENLSLGSGAHFLRVGGQYRLLHEVNTSTANFNGTFTFASLDNFKRQTADLYSVTTGKPTITLLTGDLGAYAEDEWMLRRGLNASFGLRLETQSAVPSEINLAPRASISWSVERGKKHTPLFTLRAGAGVFYQRFASNDMLTSVRLNGANQQVYLVDKPTFYSNIPSVDSLIGTAPTLYVISPRMRIASENIFSLSAERSLGKYGAITATYYAIRGVHQYNSENVNAPLADGSYPLSKAGATYNFASDGIMKAQSLTLNANLQFGNRANLFALYVARRQNNDTFGSTSFPSQPYDVSADYAPSGTSFEPIGQRFSLGANLKLPYRISLDVFTAVLSNSRFDITTGTDRNQDTQFNDRPAFATNPTGNSLLYHTRYGDFDANPQPGEAIIPRNFAIGPALFYSGIQVAREFEVGPRITSGISGQAKTSDSPISERRYKLQFGIDIENVTNSNNAGKPVGVLTSPYFGRSISTSNSFIPLSAANRVVFLNTSLRF